MSPSTCDVSVITVNWNGKEHLEKLIPSLLPLGCCEILVVDNASSDGSVQFLEKNFPQVRVLQNRENRGFAHPCNQGAREAQGEVVAFINNDARADPRWLEAALPGLSRRQPCVASRILDWEGQRIDYNGSSLQYLGYALQKDLGRLAGEVGHEEQVLFPCGGAMLIDRDYFLEIGGFDENYFAIYEDVDLGWRIWLRGQQVGFCPESIVYHRGHSTLNLQGQPRTRYLMHRNALLTILKNYQKETLERVFPLALLMAVRRAILFSGVERESFYLWDKTRAGLEASDPNVEFRVLDAFNQLVALDDVIRDLPRILERRRIIQESRKRSDREILQLFRDPFRVIVEDPDYRDSEASLLRWMGLEELFRRPLGTPEDAVIDDLEQRIRKLRSEISRLRFWGQKALDHPPDTQSAPGPSDFFRTWKREGLGMAWQRFVERVNRGL